MDGQGRPGRGDDLLLFCPSELTQDSLSNCSWLLDSKRVHEHVGGGSHGGQLAVRFPGTERVKRFAHAIAMLGNWISHQSHLCKAE